MTASKNHSKTWHSYCNCVAQPYHIITLCHWLQNFALWQFYRCTNHIHSSWQRKRFRHGASLQCTHYIALVLYSAHCSLCIVLGFSHFSQNHGTLKIFAHVCVVKQCVFVFFSLALLGLCWLCRHHQLIGISAPIYRVTQKKCPIRILSSNLLQKSSFTFQHVFRNEHFKHVSSGHLNDTPLAS